MPSIFFLLVSMTGYTICRDCKVIDLLDGASNIGADNFIPYSLRSEFQLASSLGEYYGDHIPRTDLRNFSFVERFHKENVSYYANKLADELADDIQEEKDRQEKRKEDYQDEEVFKLAYQDEEVFKLAYQDEEDFKLAYQNIKAYQDI